MQSSTTCNTIAVARHQNPICSLVAVTMMPFSLWWARRLHSKSCLFRGSCLGGRKLACRAHAEPTERPFQFRHTICHIQTTASIICAFPSVVPVYHLQGKCKGQAPHCYTSTLPPAYTSCQLGVGVKGPPTRCRGLLASVLFS